MRKLNKKLLVSLLALAGVILFSPRAHAHAHLHGAEPAQGSVVKAAPRHVTLHFSEALEASLCKVEVKEVPGGKVVSQGKPRSVDASTLEQDLESLAPAKAEYEVQWKVVSKDTHKMSGSYKFSVDPKAK